MAIVKSGLRKITSTPSRFTPNLSCKIVIIGFHAFLYSTGIVKYLSIIYEVNLRQYTHSGAFNAFAEHLPRLKTIPRLTPSSVIYSHFGKLEGHWRLDNEEKAVISFTRENELDKVTVLFRAKQLVSFNGERHFGEYQEVFLNKKISFSKNSSLDLEPFTYLIYVKR